MREVVVRGRDYHPDHQIHETDDSGSHPRTTLWSRSCLGAVRPAQADVNDRRYRPTMGPVASSRRPRTVVYFLSTLSFADGDQVVRQRCVLDDDSAADCLLADQESDLGRRPSPRRVHGDLRDHGDRGARRRARELPAKARPRDRRRAQIGARRRSVGDRCGLGFYVRCPRRR
jgi:hypothetical protein